MWSRTSDHATVALTGPEPTTESDPEPSGRSPQVQAARRRALRLGPLLTVALYAAGTAAGLVRLAPLAVAVCALALAAGLVLAALLTAKNLAVAAYGSACAVVAAGWLAYAALAGRWSWPPGLVLAAVAAALIPVYPEIRRRQEQEAERARQAAEAEEAAKAQRKWPELLARIGHKGIRWAGQEPTLAGYLVHLRLPGSGQVTYSGLVPASEKLEVAARMRHGSLRFERGTQAHEVILHVAERDVLAETVLLPAEPGTLSITRPVPVGLFEDGQVCALTLREVATLIVGLRGSGKALALDTPVPTPGGWTTMGEIRADDVVYDENGQPCRVTDAWDVRYGRPCYEVEFSDGSTIVADADHQWLVDTDASRRSARAKANLLSGPRKTTGIDWHHDQEYRRKLPEIVTTETMRGSLRTPRRSGVTSDGAVNNYSIRIAAPLQADDAELPVPPYTLGAWLGDGWSATGTITTADPEILTEMEHEGETVWIMPSTDKEAAPRPKAERVCLLAGTSPCSPTGKAVARGLCHTHWAAERRNGRLEQWSPRIRDTVIRARVAGYRIGGLKVRLRQLGVLGAKHIPAAYLRASVAQRRALLAGLLDTDGHCTAHGSIEFYSTSERLARDVRHLAATLGYKPTLRSKTARLDGKDCGTAWTVAFTTADKVFRLQRKTARQVTSERSTACHRYVTAIRPVPSVPVRCIAVDSPSHLYLVGEACIPTHNSNLLNVLLAQLARCPDVLIFAIDLKGGRMAAPWIEPWLAGRTPRPVVDWLATDREEAARMLRALERAVQARSRSGSGGEKISPSPRQPAVLLVCDEIAVILGIGTSGPRTSVDGVTNATLSRLATHLVMTGRSEAIDLIMATQRGTPTMIGSTDLKSQCAVRIGLGVASRNDAEMIIPDDARIATDLARLTHPGTGIVQQGKNGRVLPVKFFRIEHDMISQIAERYGDVRPGPDKLLEEALGEDYRTRWSPGRIARIPGVGSRPLVPVLAGGQQRILIEAPPEPDPAAPPETGLPQTGLPQTGLPQTGLPESGLFETGLPENGLPDIGLSESGLPDTGLPDTEPPRGPAEERFAELTASAAEDAGHPARHRIAALLRSAGVRGMTVRGIAEQLSWAGHDVAQQTIQRWLTEEVAAGRVEHASYGRWKWRGDE